MTDGLRDKAALHRYFESEVVDLLPLTLLPDVFNKARRSGSWTEVTSKIPQKDRPKESRDGLLLSFALASLSHDRLSKVNETDRKSALISPSKQGKDRTVAKRKSAQELLKAFQPFVIDCMASGAVVLANLWILAMKKPEISTFRLSEFCLSCPAGFYPARLSLVSCCCRRSSGRMNRSYHRRLFQNWLHAARKLPVYSAQPMPEVPPRRKHCSGAKQVRYRIATSMIARSGTSDILVPSTLHPPLPEHTVVQESQVLSF